VATCPFSFDVDPASSAVLTRWAGERLVDRLGVKITEWDPERVVGTMPVADNRQYFGLLHGGARAVLAESLGSVAGWLICTPLHRGCTMATYEIRIRDEQDRPVCTARLTCLLRDRPPD
jgi:acyl-coenzyme A thioesterase PaaI-like protein